MTTPRGWNTVEHSLESLYSFLYAMRRDFMTCTTTLGQETIRGRMDAVSARIAAMEHEG